MKAAYHPNQPARLAALRSYDILDTPRESDFDDIVELAAQICDTPISVINLIDSERQWFKAEVGLGARETPLETSICAHVILSDDFVMIEDTQADARTADNELCIPQDGLRFYAGALLKTEKGLPIGTLCVLDNVPRRLDDRQCFAIKVLAKRVMTELNLRRAVQMQDVIRDEMDHRIKNSLASVSAAVRLHYREAERTGEVEQAFDAVQRQLDAVAAVHEGIYCTPGTDVDARTYLSTLGQNLEASLPRDFALSISAAEVSVPPDIASTIGLIVNEFSANTVKHGSKKASSSTEISVQLEHEGAKLTLTCCNNVPTGNGSLSDGRTGLGSKLMRASVATHGGTLEEKPSAEGHCLVARIPFS